jgi:hypothetical protein
MNPAADWAAYLDSLDEEVRHVGRLAAAHDEASSARPFLPPEHLGPLPEELASRARDVLATISDVSRQVRAELSATSAQLEELGRHDVRGPKPPSSVDLQA